MRWETARRWIDRAVAWWVAAPAPEEPSEEDAPKVNGVRVVPAGEPLEDMSQLPAPPVPPQTPPIALDEKGAR